MSLADTELLTEVALERVIRRLEEAWCPPPVPEVDSYGYRPLPLPVLLAGIDTLRKLELPLKTPIHDLGCGLGRTLLCLWAFGYTNLTGTECMPQFAAVARGMVPIAVIHEGDVATADISGAQVVYAYRPFKNSRLAELFADWLVNRTRPGQYLWLPQVDPIWGCEHVGGYVYRRAD
jgi:hypothetical protein